MSDWRGNDKGGKKQDLSPKRLPVIPPLEKTVQPKKDWRSKSESTSLSSSGTDRNWTGGSRQSIPKSFVLKKSAIVGLLGLMIVGALATYIIWLLRENPRLPLIVSVSTSYSGAKDLGENGFSKEVVEFIGQRLKNKNISSIVSKDSELLLLEVAKNRDWLRNFSDIKSQDFVRGGKIRGGGPGRNVTAYYVSCYIVRTNASSIGEWMLVAENDDPYEPDYKKSGLSVKTFFERIAEQTAPGTYALIGLDVKMPSIVGNLGDLEFPSEAIESAFESLLPELKNRLIVTLPCGGKKENQESGTAPKFSNQESWMAPEFSNSVFGHFFLKGVFTGFEDLEKIVTMASFEESLSERIQSWVQLRRFALQRPAFLMSEATNKQKANIKLFESTGARAKDFVPERLSREQLSTKFKDLDSLWKSFEPLRSYHRWSPLAYAEIESQLLQMEDLAEYEDSAKSDANYWPEIMNGTKTKIEQLKSQIELSRRVSLIEARSHGLMLPNLPNKQFANILIESEASGPKWLMNPSLWPWLLKSEAVTEQTPSGRSRDDKCFLVWNVLQRVAKTEDESGWSRAFSRKNIQAALQYIGSPEGGTTEWLEIQLLKIIRDEIDFPDDESKSSLVTEAIAKTLATFSDLQEISTAPNHETSWWTDRQITDLDKKFLNAFDLLVANQYEKCIQEIKSFQNNIDNLRRFRNELDMAMGCRDDAFQIAPHALASLMRLYRYHADTKPAPGETFQTQWEYLANHLGLAVAKALEIQKYLEDHDTNNVDPNYLDRTDLERVITELDRCFKDLESTAKLDQETIRNSRIALRWPRLPLDARIKFHENLAKYYGEDPNKVELDATSSNSIPEPRSLRKIGEAFLNPLKDTVDRETFQTMVDGDLRFELRNGLADEPQSEMEMLRKDIYRMGYKTRIRAASFGQRASANKLKENVWPWNSVAQFQRLCDANYETMNGKRLMVARWGDRDVEDPTQKKFFFQRLAEQYRPARDILGDYAQAKKAMETSPTILNRLNQDAEEDIKQIQLELAADTSEGADSSIRKISVNTTTHEWPSAIAALKLGRENRKPLFQNVKDVALPIKLELESQKSTLTLSSDSAEEKLFWSLRGHYRGYSIPPPVAKSTYRIDFKQIDVGESKVQVSAKKSTPFTVLVLLDCSNSMGRDHVKAKQTVSDLLTAFERRKDQGETPVRVGLIPFGLVLKRTVDELESKTDEAAQKIGLKRWGDQVYFTDIMDAENFPRLHKVLDANEIQPRGLTPLYDAICAACAMDADSRTRIVVVSDGSNNVDLHYLPLDVKDNREAMKYNGPKNSDKEVFDQLSSKKSSLFVFQFANERYMEKLARDNEQEQLNDAKNSLATLRSLMSRLAEKGLAKKNDRLVYPSFSEIQKEILDSFPRSIVRVRNVGNDQPVVTGNFLDEIAIPYQGEPFWVTIGVESNGEKELLSEKILITGNQKLELEHRSDTGVLEFKTFDDTFNDTEERKRYKINFGTKDLSNRLLAYPKSVGGKLSFEVAIRGANEQKEKKIFTVPPSFVLALTKPSGSDLQRSYVLADFGYVPGRHYPILRFPELPWTQNQQPTTKKADLDIWFADELPTGLGTHITLGTNDSKLGLDGIVTCTRVNGEVSVTVKSLQGDRIFVYFPQSKKSIREFPDGEGNVEGKELHKFTIENGNQKEIEVVLIKWSELTNAAEQGQVKHHYFKEQPVLR